MVVGMVRFLSSVLIIKMIRTERRIRIIRIRRIILINNNNSSNKNMSMMCMDIR